MARIRVDGTLLTTSLVTMHTVNNNVQATFVEIRITNDDTVDRLPEVQFIPQGQSAAAKYKEFAPQAGNAVRAGETVVIRRYPMLDAGDFIQAKKDSAPGGSTNDVLHISMGIVEESV